MLNVSLPLKNKMDLQKKDFEWVKDKKLRRIMHDPNASKD